LRGEIKRGEKQKCIMSGEGDESETFWVGVSVGSMWFLSVIRRTLGFITAREVPGLGTSWQLVRGLDSIT
jgi:hypothetical protein